MTDDTLATGRALILDFGGVISRTLFETHDLNEQALGLVAGTLTWRGPFDPDSDPLWQAMQRDEISERDYWLQRTRETGRLVGEDWSSMQQMVQRLRGDDALAVIRPEFLVSISQAKQAGVQLAVLSNELDLFYGENFRDKLSFLQDFAAIIDATYTGILKPDPKAYQAVSEALQMAPGQCVFVDDQLRNIHGAQAVGMQTVHFNVMEPAASYQLALTKLRVSGASALGE